MTAHVLKVSSKSDPNSVAGALAGELRNANRVELHAIGAGAVNQAVKAVAIARGIVAPNGMDLITIPAFGDIKVKGESKDSEEYRTIMRLIVENR